LSAIPLFLVGILLLPTGPIPLSARTRVFMDGVMIMAAMVTFSWYFVLGPTLLQGADTALGKSVGRGLSAVRFSLDPLPAATLGSFR
jgi:hypothetical protein